MIYTLVKNLFKILFTIFLRLKVEGTENIPKDCPLVIASNHLSLLDPPVLGTAATGADRAAIKHGIDILESGQVLAIFPEGTRSKTGELGKAQPGALMMASKAKATIVPACIIGTDYKRHGRIWPKVTVRFGKPMPFPEDAVVNKEFLHAMTEELMQHIAKLQAGEDV